MEMCRACLATKVLMIPLNETLVASYNLLTNLNVSIQDGFPQSLCPNCVEIMKSFKDFREKSITSEASLREIIQDKKPKDLIIDQLCLKREVKVEIENENLFEYLEEPFDYQEEALFCIKTDKIPDISDKKHSKCKRGSKSHSKKANNKVNLRAKKSDNKLDESTLLCGICTKKFEDIDNLKSHLHSHMKYTECEICHERFSSWHRLLAHRLDHIPKKQGHCHLCHKRFLSGTYLEYHYLTTHNDDQQVVQLPCKHCHRTYKNPRKLKKHLNVVHAEARFFCDCCSKGFTNKSQLKVHLRSSSNDKSFVCDLCGFRCNQKQSLKLHKLRRHTPTSVTCKGCNRVFASREQHESHNCIELACPVCGKVMHPKMMSRHVKTHGEASHKCPRCPAVYKTRGALRVHADRHDGVRRLQCSYCPAKFFSHSVLLKHKRIHTGEKPYVCNICSKAFTGGGNLKVHMKVHGIHAVVKKDVKDKNAGDILKLFSY